MAKDEIQLGEALGIEKVSGGQKESVKKNVYPEGDPIKLVEVKLRHKVMGWSLLAAIMSVLAYFGYGLVPAKYDGPARGMQEAPGLTETLKHKIGGVLSFRQMRAGHVIGEWGPFQNTIVNAGETALRDCFNGNSGTECTDVVSVLRFHALGTSSAAVAETQTACQTELTTQYAVDNTRPTGSQTTNGTNIYRTVGTNTVDGSATIEEFCLMSAATAGTMWTRILTGTVTLVSGDSLVSTYDLTIE